MEAHVEKRAKRVPFSVFKIISPGVNLRDSYGCVSFFCTKQGGDVNSREKVGEKREYESEEEHTTAE